MARFKANEVSWEKVNVLGKEGLVTDIRIDRNSVPDGWTMYELRHDEEDWGEIVEIAIGVLVNFWGTLLVKEPFKIEISPKTGNGYLLIDEAKDWEELGEIVRF